MDKDKKPTLSMVAEKAGVSTATASRVLNGKGVSATATASAVRLAAQELQYDIGTQGRRKHGQTSPSKQHGWIAIVAETTTDGVWPLMLHTLYKTLGAQGYTVQMLAPEDCHTPNTLNSECRGVVTFHDAPPTLRKLLAPFPNVALLGEGRPMFPAGDRVTYDHDTVGELAAQWLAEQGCRSVAGIAPSNNQVGAGRMRGFTRAAQDAGIEVEVVVAPSVGPEGAEDAARQLAALPRRPQGIFAFNDYILVHLWAGLATHGMVPGVDVQVIGCDFRDIVTVLRPAPATIDIHLADIAQQAATILCNRILAPQTRPSVVTIVPELITPDRVEAKGLALAHDHPA